jgi:hypothetical protein
MTAGRFSFGASACQKLCLLPKQASTILALQQAATCLSSWKFRKQAQTNASLIRRKPATTQTQAQQKKQIFRKSLNHNYNVFVPKHVNMCN